MPAYLDHAATTPLRHEAFEAMSQWLGERFGNPSGAHSTARAARAAIDDARDRVAGALGTEPGGIVFTSGGTEADNLAIAGVLRGSAGGEEPSVVTTAIEHHAVLHACTASPANVRTARVGPDGVVDLDSLEECLDPSVALVSVMLANNEVGTIQPLADVARLVRRHAPHAVLHTDAVHAAQWLDVAVLASEADMISVSAHKFGGPQGVGALAVRGDVKLEPIIHGGGQERDRRSGTHNVAGIVGMAAAMDAARSRRPSEAAAASRLRDRLVDGLLAAVAGSVETGDRSVKVPGNAHLRFPGVESESLLVLLDEGGICASAGSACASGAMEASHVLIAMGISPPEALSSLRMTLGHTTTADEVDLALEVIPDAVRRLGGS